MTTLNPNLIKLTEILSDCEFHDGDSLGTTLNITRSAIWKMVKKLNDYGIKINSIKGKGYSLDDPLLLLDKNKITKKLPKSLTKKIDLEIFESIPSTATYLKNNFDPTKISICTSEYQSSGRGRFNRTWYSPFGQNIYLSCRYHMNKDISELGGLTFAVCVAIMNTLKTFGLASLIKWPNDVMCNFKKISGNLIEISAESNGTSDAIISIGLNVNMNDFDTDALIQPWTSMKKESRTHFNRNEVIAELINELNTQIDKFESDGIASFLKITLKHDFLNQKRISVTKNSTTYTGTAAGIDEQGRLMLKLANGSVSTFSSGDTQILK